MNNKVIRYTVDLTLVKAEVLFYELSCSDVRHLIN